MLAPVVFKRTSLLRDAQCGYAADDWPENDRISFDGMILSEMVKIGRRLDRTFICSTERQHHRNAPESLGFLGIFVPPFECSARAVDPQLFTLFISDHPDLWWTGKGKGVKMVRSSVCDRNQVEG